MPSRGRRSKSPFAVIAVAFLGAATLRCGLLASPGEYASGVPQEDGGVGVPSNDGGTADGSRPDGGVTPSPGGTIAVVAGERDPASPEDNPAWSSDTWLGSLDAQGHVTGWTTSTSAPVVGPFDATTIVAGRWLTLSFGFGLNGNRANALQGIAWSPGPSGEWRASPVNMPGGLDETTRVFLGAHVLVVGGTRTSTVDGGQVTYWTGEVHVADVDVDAVTPGPTRGAGTDLVVNRSRPGLLVHEGRLYVVGGRTSGGAPASAVESAPVDAAAGTVGAFAAEPPLTVGGEDHRVFLPSLAVASGYLVVAGGRTNGSSAPSDVVVASRIDPQAKTLGPFAAKAKLPRPLRDFSLVAQGDMLYVLGGQTANGRSADVLSARVGVDGTISAWESAPNAKLPSPRSDLVAVPFR